MTTPKGLWAAYEPAANDPWDLSKVAHLHRRAGFGATWGELQRDLKDGPAASVERLLRPRERSADERQALDGLRQGVLASGDDERLKAWWLYRFLDDPDPVREKLTLFWHGHFATSNRKVQSVPLMLEQNELLRRHALGRFAELLGGIVGDGAMLVWLDGINSHKKKPNENFAREFLELFTVGIGNYTEQDIREAARAFTGWTWHKQTGKPTAETPGWLARCLDQQFAEPRQDTPALNISPAFLPQALSGSGRQVPSLVSLEQFRRRLGVPAEAGAAEQRAALDQLAHQERGEAGSLLQFIERSTLVTYASSARLEEMLRNPAGAGGYPAGYPLARRLRLIAQLVKAGLSTAIYYTQLDGFDTHSNQLGTHDGLLRAVGDSLRAFLDDLNQLGDAGRILVLVFSEFGRRLAENGSAGTDHGTAAPMFLVGSGVKAGLHGPYPNLQDLDDGDPKFALDFRRLYAAVLERWLGCPSAGVLGGTFEPLAVFPE
jgi:hypothetical protein